MTFFFVILVLKMKHISEVLNVLNDGNPHKVVFVSKSKGVATAINKAVVTSSNYERRKFNLMSIDSKQVRTVYYVLIISIDNEEVYL